MPTAYNLRLMNSSISACCPSCVEMNSINHIALRYPNSAMSGMHTNRTMPTLAPASTPSAKAALPDWLFPHGTGSSARHQSHPNAVFARSIPSRPSHLDPTEIPPQDKDIYLVDLKFCPDTNLFSILEAATAQHAYNLTRLINQQPDKPKQELHALHIILTGLSGIYNDYTIKPLVNLGQIRQMARSLATELSCHAVQKTTMILTPGILEGGE
eukprot:987765-Pelagomonas_calceolata.AAC.1